MTASDLNQTWRALTRCTAELRGVAARLRESEPGAAELVETVAASVSSQWLTVRKFVEGGKDGQ